MSADPFVCSVAARRRDEPLVATASQVGSWLLIEVDGAWGSRPLIDTELAAYTSPDFTQRLADRGIRGASIRRRDRRGADSVAMFWCVPGLPGQASRMWQRTVTGLAEVEPIAELLRGGDEPGDGWIPAEPLAIVCTNGRHDQCCANVGRTVIRAARASHLADRVWECSHVGGDRFAANVVVLPHSLYFGRCDEATAVRLIDDAFAGVIDLAHFRGRSVYGPLRQAVEHFVRTNLSIEALDAVRVAPVSDDGRAEVDVLDAEGAAARYVVVVRQQMVTVDEPISCSGEPGQQVARFELVSIEPQPVG